jgi:hypothetical protein
MIVLALAATLLTPLHPQSYPTQPPSVLIRSDLGASMTPSPLPAWTPIMDLDPAQRLKFSNICAQLQSRYLIAAAYLNELMLPFSLLAHRVITTLVIPWLTEQAWLPLGITGLETPGHLRGADALCWLVTDLLICLALSKRRHCT